MEIETIKSTIRNIKAPDIKFDMDGPKDSSILDFMQYLKKLDKRDRRILIISYGIGIILVIVYLLWFVVSYEDIEIKNRIARGLFVIAYIIFSIFLKIQYIHFARIDYTLTPKEFLRNAKERHKLWSLRQLILIPIFLLINIGLTIEFSFIWESENIIMEYLKFQLLFFGIISGALLMGRWVWKKEKSHIVEVIDRLIVEFQNDDGC